MSKYGVFSGPYLPMLSPNTRKYEPEKTPHLDTFHAMNNHTFSQTQAIRSKF